MSIDLQHDQPAAVPAEDGANARSAQQSSPPAVGSWVERATSALRAVDYPTTLLIALVMAVAWCGLFLANNALQILAGVVPVMGGLFLGRRIKGNYLAHGLVLGISGFLIGLVLVLVYAWFGSMGTLPMPVVQTQAGQPASSLQPGELLFFYLTFALFALLPFPAFGTVMAGRTAARNRELEREVTERGGKLERPGTVRTLEDLQGLSLPQLGSYVTALYRKKGFEFRDYRFIDKDKHLDLDFTYQNESYLMRLSVADKVRTGTVESLVQDMKRRAISKGVVITSTDFAPETRRSAANKRNLVLIDGTTLFDIAEG